MAVRRKEGEIMEGEWEFPGGKIQDGEDPEQTVIREIKEELEICIIPEEPFRPFDYEYPRFYIRLYPYRCRWISGTVRMHVHDECRWLDKNEMGKVNWSEADQALINEIKDLI